MNFDWKKSSQDLGSGEALHQKYRNVDKMLLYFRKLGKQYVKLRIWVKSMIKYSS